MPGSVRFAAFPVPSAGGKERPCLVLHCRTSWHSSREVGGRIGRSGKLDEQRRPARLIEESLRLLLAPAPSQQPRQMRIDGGALLIFQERIGNSCLSQRCAQ